MVDRLSPILKEEGAEAISFSLIRTENLHNPELSSALDEIDQYSWIIFTSANGVECFFEDLKILRKDIRDFAHIHFAVIGEGTKKALEDHGIYSDFIPLAYSSEDLAKAIIPVLKKDDKVLMLRAEEANQVLPQSFEKAGLAYTNISLYHTVRDYRKADELNRLIGMMDYVTFASSSAVKAYVDMVEDLDQVKGKYISIGPVTSKTAEKLGIKIDKTAVSYTARGILDMILKDVEEEKQGKIQ
jgi:uroporphyrinogen III methyltransferase/synthase